MKKNKLSEIEWTLIWMSVRYAMNRETIASATLPEDIIKNYYHKLNDDQKEMLYKDLKENLDRYKEDAFGKKDIDRPNWLFFMSILNKDQHFYVSLTNEPHKTIKVFEHENEYYDLEKVIKSSFFFKEKYIIDKSKIHSLRLK